MRLRNFFLSVFLVPLLLSCAAIPNNESAQPIRLFAVQGNILACSPPEMMIAVQIPRFSKTADTAVANIAHQVVQKSYLMEGTKIIVDGREGTVAEVQSNRVKVLFDSSSVCTVGRTVALQVPKKTIAVVDFDVASRGQKEKSKVILEGLNSALIDTGQFIVLERTKLQSIMNEIQLSLSGLTRPTGDKVAGKLLIADLILTGSLTELQDEWDINLRIVNVRTGQALSSISLRERLFKPTEMRDAGNFNENFEGSFFDPSWAIKAETRGTKKRKHATYSVHLDATQGAHHTNQSMRIDFDFSGPIEKDFFAIVGNRKKRDISLYKGVEFYAKGTEALIGQFYILSSAPDDPNRIDQWTGIFNTERNWKKLRIPFEEMVVSRGWIKGGAKKIGATPGDQVIRLNRVEGIQFGIGSARNDGITGSLWIDQIHFYND